MDDYRKLGAALVEAEREGERPARHRGSAAPGADRLPPAVEVVPLDVARRWILKLTCCGSQEPKRATASGIGTAGGPICWQPPPSRRERAGLCERHRWQALRCLRDAWDRIVARAKLKGVTPHTLRHSFATTAQHAGMLGTDHQPRCWVILAAP